MYYVDFNIAEIGATPGVMKREIRRITKEAWERVGRHWHRFMRPVHFTHAGATKYGYTKRTPLYTYRKVKKFGHGYPLCWTSDSKARTAVENIRATSNGVKIIMWAPTLNLRPKTGTINMRDELTTVTPDEIEILMGIFTNWLLFEVDRLGSERRRYAA